MARNSPVKVPKTLTGVSAVAAKSFVAPKSSAAKPGRMVSIIVAQGGGFELEVNAARRARQSEGSITCSCHAAKREHPERPKLVRPRTPGVTTPKNAIRQNKPRERAG